VITWDRWIGNNDNEPIYFQKVLFRAFGWTLRLHKFVKADAHGCFHSHPAHAFRLILWGGYVEEVYYDATKPYGSTDGYAIWRPGMVGKIAPDFIHRVERLRNGHASYSLWLQGPTIASIELHGDGWPEDFVPFGSAIRVRVRHNTAAIRSR
jgi:hypothetical protein